MTIAAGRRLRIYALEARYECVKQWRLPTQLIFGFGFPLMFYTVFGIIFRGYGAAEGNPYGLHYLATFGAFGIISSALYGFGVGIATERGQGWMLLKRASPMPPEGYFIAKLAVSVISAAIILTLLTASGVLLLGIRLSLASWCQLALVLVLGVTPFCALGLAIGFWAGPNSAVAVVNLVNMPMAILSGLWMPLEVLPAFVRHAARYLPPYHYSQLALGAIGQSEKGSPIGHVFALLGFLVVCLALAYAGHRRDEDKTYG